MRRRGDSEKTRACFRDAVKTIQKQHVKMDIQIQRTTKALNRRHRTGLCDITRKTRVVNQVTRNRAVDEPFVGLHRRRKASA